MVSRFVKIIMSIPLALVINQNNINSLSIGMNAIAFVVLLLIATSIKPKDRNIDWLFWGSFILFNLLFKISAETDILSILSYIMAAIGTALFIYIFVTR